MRKKQPQIEYNPVCDPKSMHGYRGVRWVENVSRGLRRIGFADEIMKGEGYPRAIDHRGWFIRDDDCGGEVYRGVVYQLPARHGLPQYVYGYDDPNNDDCALLCFDPELEKREAAKQADRFAEILAEHERDYDRAWQAGRRVETLDDEIKDMRKEALAIGAEMRAAKGAPIVAPRICSALREKIRSLYHAIQKAREERDELLDTHGSQPGFKE